MTLMNRLISQRGSIKRIAFNSLKTSRVGLQRLHYSTPSTPSEPLKQTDEKLKSTRLEMPQAVGNVQIHEFKASTKRLLDMVGKSLYSEQEIFVRELISNASDALEKRRHLELASPEKLVAANPDEERCIRISTNSADKTLIFEDNGIGMTKDELLENLGVIASSGSKRFVENKEGSADVKHSSIIGQFGVGFYSAFMVGDRITVYSKSALKDSGEEGYCWKSDGQGSFEVSEATNVPIGTRIIIHLKDKAAEEYLANLRLQTIIQKYSNFVGFSIYLNSERVNTIEPLWTKSSGSVTKEEHEAFYKFISHSWDAPQFKLHYKTDAPLSISALFYIPSQHSEQSGYKRLEPGVSIYSRKVMIQPNSKAILPEWLRFVKGIVDSEDIPLNISRELLQNGILISKLRHVLTARIIKWLGDEARQSEEAYLRFYKDFGNFLKEGIISDANEYKNVLIKCLRFDSSLSHDSKTPKYTTLAKIAETSPEKNMYFLSSTSRKAALESPYLEPFLKSGTPVILSYDPMDEFVFNSIGEFEGRKLTNVETMSAQELEPILALIKDENAGETLRSFKEDEKKMIIDWFKEVLDDKSLQQITVSERKGSNSPALVTSHMSATMRRLFSMSPGFREAAVNAGEDSPTMMAPHSLELNLKSPVTCRVIELVEADKNSAEGKLLAKQIYDNARLAASILDDPRTMLKQLNELLDSYSKIALSCKKEGAAQPSESSQKELTM